MKNETSDSVIDFDTDYFRDKVKLIFDAEMAIDDEKTLYLITWSPDPSLLPNSSFEMQHEYNIDILAHYCKGCNVALWCVEANQRGNPHYHGFYQPSTDHNKERLRIASIKAMEQFGLVKITPGTTYKRLNYHTSHANCLYYYKKDFIEAMYHIPVNPINADSKSTINFAEYAYLFKTPGKRSTSSEIIQKQSQREKYRLFYLGEDTFKIPE